MFMNIQFILHIDGPGLDAYGLPYAAGLRTDPSL